MQTQFDWLLRAALAGFGVTACIAGCAGPAQQQVQREDLLAAAGFHWRSYNSPDWKAAVVGLPPHRFTTQAINGRTYYYYADPTICRCVYYGTPQEWMTYRHLLAERRIATEREVDAYLDQAATKGSGGD